MTVETKIATAADVRALKAIDSVFPRHPRREEEINKWLSQDKVLTAVVDQQIVGYAVFNHGFFGHGQLAMLMVAESHRGHGIGQTLLRGIEVLSDAPKMFVSTNQSNDRMQRLLLRNGYRICGYIEELDPGDPEILFFKHLKENERKPDSFDP